MRKIKIFLTTLAIAGVLFATSSCVDDSESASVTKVRDAKAAQLQAKATLDNATATAEAVRAEAARITAAAAETLANANKLLIEARADQIKAQTEAEKLVAEQKLLQLQSDVALAIQKNQTALDSLAYLAKVNEINFRIQLGLLKSIAADTIQRQLTNLIDLYDGIQTNLNAAISTIESSDFAITKAKLEKDFFVWDTARLINNYISNLNVDIATLEKKNARYATLVEQYEEFLTKGDPDADSIIAVREKELAVAKDTLEDLYKAQKAAEIEEDIADKALKDVQAHKKDYEDIIKGFKVINYDLIAVVALVVKPMGDTPPTSLPVLNGYNNGVPVNKNFPYVSSGDYINYIGDDKDENRKFYLSGFSYYYNANIYSYEFDNTNTNETYYVLVTVNYTTKEYSSKEDYEHKNQVAVHVKDSIDAVKKIEDYNKALTNLYKDIVTLGKAEDAAKTAAAEAKAAYDAYQKTFDDLENPSVPQITVLNTFRRAWDGRLDIPGVPANAAVDSTGGAVGALERAQDAYILANDKVEQIRVNLTAALLALDAASDAIANHNTIIETLSYGPIEKLEAEEKAAQALSTTKGTNYTEALSAYTTYSELTAILQREISNLTAYKYGGLVDDYIYNNIKDEESESESYLTIWDEESEEWSTALPGTAYVPKQLVTVIQGKINFYTDQIKQNEFSIEKYKVQQANATLYAQKLWESKLNEDGTFSEIYKTIEEAIQYYTDQIAKEEANKVKAEKQKDVYTKQLALIQQAINVLLAIDLGEEEGE
jgi:hypothetical protein